jgi:hypothetical protein
LCNGKEVGSIGSGEGGLDFGDVMDEEPSHGDLRTNVAELCGNAPEEGVLVAERFVNVAGC